MERKGGTVCHLQRRTFQKSWRFQQTCSLGNDKAFVVEAGVQGLKKKGMLSSWLQIVKVLEGYVNKFGFELEVVLLCFLFMVIYFI